MCHDNEAARKAAKPLLKPYDHIAVQMVCRLVENQDV
ncbi:hypothetical protein SDC9_171204 [bioreactor metagenome]|uniref:Uncharacterized protein n=1 Tax=bioreactor metagenome TaxID=1076179 RepID=A0A645GA82_9ZZZZ